MHNDRVGWIKYVKIYHDDAFRWLLDHKNKYDLIVADLPDPNNEALSKLYSVAFYQLVQESLNLGGVFCTQATGPDLSPLAFWSVEKSVQEAGLKHVRPFQINTPSFGNWGFVMATNQASGFNLSQIRTDINTKFIDSEILPRIFHFSKDIEKKRNMVEANQLDRPVILQYYLTHWRELNEGGKK